LEKAQYVIMFDLCEGVDLTDCWPFRDKLRAEARQLSAHSSVSKRTAIATSRQKLGRKIEAFHAKGSAFLGDISDGGDNISLEQIDCEEDNILDVGDEFDDFPDDSIPSPPMPVAMKDPMMTKKKKKKKWLKILRASALQCLPHWDGSVLFVLVWRRWQHRNWSFEKGKPTTP